MKYKEYKEYKDLRSSLRDLANKGGKYKKAADKVFALLAKSQSNNYDISTEFKVTNNGEQRINKCIKYALNDNARLVTIQDRCIILLCFAGNHDDTDKWINKHKGAVFSDNDGKLILNPIPCIESGNYQKVNYNNVSSGKILDKLTLEIKNIIKDHVKEHEFNMLANFETLTEEFHIKVLIDLISARDKDLSNIIADTINHLLADDAQQATFVLQRLTNNTQSLDDYSDEDIFKLRDSDIIRSIPQNSAEYARKMQILVERSSYKDWMLYMHPDQDTLVNAQYSGSAKLSGVSGSGKTCIIVKRSIHLAKLYPNEKILIITINKPLAKMIDELVTVASEVPRNNIEVKSIFDVFRELLIDFEPTNSKLYDDITWKSNEHIDEIWHEYYRCDNNNHDAKVMQKVHFSLISRNIYAEQYIKEEFDWIRSALAEDKRNDYTNIDRSGRFYPLQEEFRVDLLKGLKFWEDKMKIVGVIDYHGVANKLHGYLTEITPKYRCILVDESQDIGTIELAIIRKLASENENDLFLCGDAAQKVSSKAQSIKEAGIDIHSSRITKIMKNYRNSQEILKTAYEILQNNTLDLLDNANFNFLDPEYANFSYTLPMVMQAESLEQEIAYALEFAKEKSAEKTDKKTCIAFCNFTIFEIEKFGKQHNIATLNGFQNIEDNDIYFSDLEQTKGFEFDCVCIVNCSKDCFPNPNIPEQEQFRDLARFYVAMTRTKTELIISYSKQESKYISDTKLDYDNFVLRQTWQEYFGNKIPTLIGKPEKLEDFQQDRLIPDNLLDMSGEQFLYTFQAVGLDLTTIEKISSLIDGKGATNRFGSIRWRTMKEAKQDIRYNARARHLLGGKVCNLLANLSE